MPKAHVKNGRLLLAERTDLPDGAEVDAGDALDDEDRKRLLQALAESEEDVKHGRLTPAEDVIASLRRPSG